MKKIQKKLILKKKTISKLSNEQTHQVIGGRTPYCPSNPLVCPIGQDQNCTNDTCHTYCVDSNGNNC